MGFLRVERTAALTLSPQELGRQRKRCPSDPHLRGLLCPPTQGRAVGEGSCECLWAAEDWGRWWPHSTHTTSWNHLLLPLYPTARHRESGHLELGKPDAPSSTSFISLLLWALLCQVRFPLPPPPPTPP